MSELKYAAENSKPLKDDDEVEDDELVGTDESDEVDDDDESAELDDDDVEDHEDGKL